MYRVAVFCTSENDIEELFACLRTYQESNEDSALSYSLFYTLKNMEAAMEADGPFDLYMLDVNVGDTTVINYSRALQAGEKEPELILVFHTEENLLQVRLEHPNASALLLSDHKGICDALARAEKKLSCAQTEAKLIRVTTPKGPQTIAYSDILYIEYRQKRLVFHLEGDQEIITRTIRVPMEDYLFPMLEDPRFVRTHSAFVANGERAIKLEKASLLMENGTRVPISKLRSKEVQETWRSLVFSDQPRVAHVNAAIRYCESRKLQLEYIRRQPFAQCIIRVDLNKKGEPFDFVFMFVNDALCRLEGKSKETLLGASFYDVFANADPKWLPKYYETAYQGVSQSFDSYSREIGKLLSITCYQTEPGYCGCILTAKGEQE